MNTKSTDPIKCLCGVYHNENYYDDEVPFVCTACSATVMRTTEHPGYEGQRVTLVEGGIHKYGGKA